jgi:predicted aspartyl protease
MNKFRRSTILLTIAAWLAVASTSVSQEPTKGNAPGTVSAASPAIKLAPLLRKLGYVEVPLTVDKTGLLDARVTVEGVPMLFIVDSGAENMTLDLSSAKRAKLPIDKTEIQATGIGGSVPSGRTKVQHLLIGTIKTPTEAYVADFSTINAERKSRGDQPCDGALGGRFFKYFSAVIDYQGLKLYLLDPAEE